MESEDIIERWRQYVGELYDDQNRGSLPLVFDGSITGPETLGKESMKALKYSKNGRAICPMKLAQKCLSVWAARE